MILICKKKFKNILKYFKKIKYWFKIMNRYKEKNNEIKWLIIKIKIKL